MSRAVDPDGRLAQARARIAELRGASEQLDSLERLLRDLRAELAVTEGDLEARRMEWLQERQDAETTLQAYRARARELRDRLAALKSGGAESPCPTCGRILNEQLAPVLTVLGEEWDSVVQDGRWWRRRRLQLDLKPEPVQELETKAVRLHAEIEQLAERAERARWPVQELAELREQVARLERRVQPESPSDGLRSLP